MNPKRTPILLPVLLMVLLALSGGLLVWLGGGQPAAESNPPTTDSPVTEVASAADGSEVVDGEVARDDAAEDDGLERTALPGGPVTAGDAGAWIVQVWDGDPGVPAEAADVFFLDGFDGPELSDPFGQHWSDLAETRGLRFKTDSTGRAVLPRIKRWAIVTARRPGAYAFTKLGREHEDVETLVLRSDETVTVQVLDMQDRPVAEVPVGVLQIVPVRDDQKRWLRQLEQLNQAMAQVKRSLRDDAGASALAAKQRIEGLLDRQARVKAVLSEQDQAKGDTTSARRSGTATGAATDISVEPRLLARRRTDDQGLACFRHFQLYRMKPASWWPPEQSDHFAAALLLPLAVPELSRFAGRPVPDERIVLRLPPTGSVALRTVDLQGEAFRHPVFGELRMRGMEIALWQRIELRKEQGEEAILFPRVGLGLQFTAHCRLEDRDFQWDVPLFAGPTNPGQRVSVDVLVAPDSGVLRGRVLDRAGRPLAGVLLSLLINSPEGRLEGEELILDDEGRFHLPYKRRDGQPPPFELVVRRRRVEPVAGVRLPLPDLAMRGVTDLGDLTLDVLPVVAEGTVVDDTGRPIAGATIRLQREREVPGRPPRFEFRSETFTEVQSDDRGAWEMFGRLDAGRYRVRAEAEDHFPSESPDLRAGARVEMVLMRKAALVGTVLTPDWLSAEGLRVHLESLDDPTKQRDDSIHEGKGSPFIYFDWVEPGAYNLAIRSRDFPDPILRIDGIVVVPGQTDVHPRLEELDLRGLLFRFAIMAVDGAGATVNPDRPLLARVVDPGGASVWVGLPWRKDRVEVVSATPQLTVLPLASGYQAEPAVLVPGDSELRFLERPPLELSFPGLRALIGETTAWIRVRRESGDDLPERLGAWDRRSGRIARSYQRVRFAGAPLGADDTVRLKLVCDGRYRVLAYLGERTRDAAPAAVEMGAIDVNLQPGSDVQRLTLKVNPEAVRAALGEPGG